MKNMPYHMWENTVVYNFDIFDFNNKVNNLLWTFMAEGVGGFRNMKAKCPISMNFEWFLHQWTGSKKIQVHATTWQFLDKTLPLPLPSRLKSFGIALVTLLLHFSVYFVLNATLHSAPF